MAGWAVGFCLVAIRLALSALVLMRITRRATRVTSGPVREALEEARSTMGVSSRVRLSLSDRATVMIWGLARPHLLLPRCAESWEPEMLQSVLLHELAHVRRLDLQAQWIAQLSCACHWFNPLAWIASWRSREARELACDDLVVARGVPPSHYARHLLDIAATLSHSESSGAPPTSLAMARSGEIESRLNSILCRHRRQGPTRATTPMIIMLIAGLVVVPLAMLAAFDGGDERTASTESLPEDLSGTPEFNSPQVTNLVSPPVDFRSDQEDVRKVWEASRVALPDEDYAEGSPIAQADLSIVWAKPNDAGLSLGIGGVSGALVPAGQELPWITLRPKRGEGACETKLNRNIQQRNRGHADRCERRPDEVASEVSRAESAATLSDRSRALCDAGFIPAPSSSTGVEWSTGWPDQRAIFV